MALVSPGGGALTQGPHLSVVGFGGLAPSLLPGGSSQRALNLTSPKRVQADLGFLCDCPKDAAAEISSPLSWSSWVTCISSASDRPPFVSSARFGSLEPWLPWGWAWGSHSPFTENNPPSSDPRYQQGQGGWLWYRKKMDVENFQYVWCMKTVRAGVSGESLSAISLQFPSRAGLLTTLPWAGPWSGILSPSRSPPWTLLIATWPFLLEPWAT